jgi:hypothetical protein
MIITKPIHGTMEIKVDQENGVIWLNTSDGYCILRICGLKFENTEEKFEGIDITRDKVMMYPSSGLEKPELISNFLESVLDIVLQKLVTKPIKDYSKILTFVLDSLKKNLQEEK